MRIPIKLENDPVAEAVIEIRFESNLPADAIFGVFYNSLKDIFPEYKTLPLLQVPENVRNNDQNLRFAPLYSLVKGNFQFNIGSRVASLTTKNPYSGWDTFSNLAYEAFSKVNETGAITKTTRFGLRYIKFFETAIFDKLDLNISSPFESSTVAKNITLHQLNGNLKTKILIADNAQQNENGKIKNGSIIDLDTFVEGDVPFFNDIQNALEKSHTEEKNIFFTLLNEAFIQELGATYE
jgi:uncharacterized protein (TIGR04255 family)